MNASTSPPLSTLLSKLTTVPVNAEPQTRDGKETRRTEREIAKMGAEAVHLITTFIESHTRDCTAASAPTQWQVCRQLQRCVRVLGRIRNTSGVSAVLSALLASSVWAKDKRMEGWFGREPGTWSPLSQRYAMEIADSAASLRRTCKGALVQIGPAALPPLEQRIAAVKNSSMVDWDKKYAMRALRQAHVRLVVRKWLHV